MSAGRRRPGPAPPAPASMARPTVVPPTRRSRMPVRSMIHASVVSSVASRSALVTTLSGRAVPQPVIPHRGCPRVLGARQAVRSQAMGWRLVTRSPSTASTPASMPANGERTSWSPTWPSTSPAAMRVPSREAVDRAEHAGGRADHDPLGGEEVLALVRRRRAAAPASAMSSSSRSRSSGVATERVRAPVDGALGHAGEHGARAELDEVGDARPRSRSCSVWRQRTGLHSWATSRPAHSSPLVWARASTLDDDGQVGVARGRPRRAPCAGGRGPAP